MTTAQFQAFVQELIKKNVMNSSANVNVQVDVLLLYSFDSKQVTLCNGLEGVVNSLGINGSATALFRDRVLNITGIKYSNSTTDLYV